MSDVFFFYQNNFRSTCVSLLLANSVYLLFIDSHSKYITEKKEEEASLHKVYFILKSLVCAAVKSRRWQKKHIHFESAIPNIFQQCHVSNSHWVQQVFLTIDLYDLFTAPESYTVVQMPGVWYFCCKQV